MLITSLQVHLNLKEVSFLPWKSILTWKILIKYKFFLWTKFLENLLLTKYLPFIAVTLWCLLYYWFKLYRSFSLVSSHKTKVAQIAASSFCEFDFKFNLWLMSLVMFFWCSDISFSFCLPFLISNFCQTLKASFIPNMFVIDKRSKTFLQFSWLQLNINNLMLSSMTPLLYWNLFHLRLGHDSKLTKNSGHLTPSPSPSLQFAAFQS